MSERAQVRARNRTKVRTRVKREDVYDNVPPGEIVASFYRPRSDMNNVRLLLVVLAVLAGVIVVVHGS